MGTFLVIAGFVFIVLVIAVIGFISSFMFQVDVCGSDSSRDL